LSTACSDDEVDMGPNDTEFVQSFDLLPESIAQVTYAEMPADTDYFFVNDAKF